jgi:small subunit ribosomal protein S6
MNKYELTLVLNGKLEEDAKAAALEKVQGYITRYNGVVTNVDDWGKKRFAYDIQKMKEGFYYFIKFESEDTACPNHVESEIRIYEPVVRYLIVADEAE